MKAEQVNAFYKATRDVFQLMLDIIPEKKDLKIAEEMVSSRDANIALGVTGDLQGTVLFSLSKEMALEMIKIMSGMEIDKIDRFASSALGEVANIIGGNAATILSENEYICDIVPPQIFIGKYESLSMANEKVLQLSLETSIGEFDISMFLKE